ncbi:unnamed protein product, partial [Nippostrongylus brasiliensis]|uniref:KASH domain-containing protein n=1 Tax=Nippostrongylus brasiliensis TaxID=27835 RepID=A0A158QZL3_NIPBR
MVETGFEERLESLKMSGEEDCSVAHNIVQEVGEELVAFCPQLNERHTEARQVLTKKMELFRRLQNYYDAVKYLRNQNIARNRITLIEVPAISSELQSLLERCDSEWQKDALQLRAELNAISGNKLRDLMRARVEYLDAVRDFIASADSSIDIAQMATPSDSPQPLQEKAKELCKDLETKAENLKHLQAPAEMIISDLIPQQLIRKFRWQLIGPSDEDTKSFDEAARYLEELINRNLPSSQDPQQFLSVTLELKRMEEEESKTFDEMTELAILDEHKPTRDRIAALFKNRQEQRKRLTLNFLYSYHDYLNTLFRSYEEKVVYLINNRALTEVQEFNDGEWKRWKEAVGELESALDAPMRVRLRPEFADLQRKAFSLDGKIGRSMMSSAKQRRHEERLQAKLTQLESWLDAMENDTDVVERMLPGDEQTTRLTQLLISCLGQQRLVGKLERLNVQNRDHVQQLCQKYYIILNRLRSHNLDESALPIHVGTLVQGAPTRSQLSISSLASSDFADRPESVQSVGSSIDIASASADSELPMEKAIGDIRRKLHILIQSYNDAPKNLATCIADYNLLLTYRGELNNLYVDLPPGNDTKKEALENSLHHLMEHLNETAGKLQEEIDEEVSLSAKEKEIVHELHTLEQRVKGRDVTDVDVVHDLEQLQAQMDLLRMISRKPRQFVESDLMERGGGSSSRSRSKRKVLVMVTNTVTTIIQVVEERLLTIEARSRDPVVQQKLDLVKTNLKKLEEETEITSPESATGILATAMARGVPGRDTFEATVLGVEQALHIADNIDLESCDDPHVLSESLHILEDQSISMDALCNTASELAKDGEPYYLDTVSALQERLLAVKQSLADRLAKLSDETPADIIVPTEEQPTTSTAEFDKIADEILSATISAEKVLDDETADSERLLKAKELLECQVPVLSRISDLASLRAQSGDPEGIDTVSSITEQFNSVRYALDDRINEFSAQGHEDIVIIPEADSIPTTSSADFNKLVDDLREEIGSAEKALDDTSEDVQRLQDAKERLQSHEPVLSTLRDMASTRAQQGDPEGIDVISSLSEEFEGVRYAIDDRIEELADKGESGAEFEDYGSDAEQRTSADDFLQLASEVRAAITSVEKVLDDETADSLRTHEAREKILNQEDVLSRLSEIAVAKAHSGQTDAIDDLSLLQQEYNAVRYAIEDKLEEFASKSVADTVADGKSSTDKGLFNTEEQAPIVSVDVYPMLSEVLVNQLLSDVTVPQTHKQSSDAAADNRREVVERLAKVDELITTLPTTR